MAFSHLLGAFSLVITQFPAISSYAAVLARLTALAEGILSPPRIRSGITTVEDDERVRQLTVTRLKMIGHDVIEARDGFEALNLLQSGAHVDLVFTDMVMPGGLSGRDVAHKARDLKPGIKVLLTTGYAEDLAHADDLQQECLKVLRKPYRQAELAMALRDVLDMALP